ncbi:ATP-binding cassette domain-containing protein [Escherichia coli]
MPYLLEMKNITKTFGSVKAIDNVSLRLNAGEIVSLCGENGSGKSTLMKVLCGIYPHGSYEGEIIFAGEEIQASHIRDTERKGIAPTRGIDIGAKYEIYKLINQLVQQGIAVIVISSELPEVLGLSDRVLVMHEGKLKANLINHNLTQEQVMEAALRSEHHVEKQSV